MLNKTELISNVTRTFHRVSLVLKKHSPEILVGAGVVGTVVSTVMACKATTKLDDILAESKEKIEASHELLQKPELVPVGKSYTEEDHKKDLTVIYAQTGLEIVKLYAPAVGVGILSISAILSGHNILRKRNIAIAAAYSALDTSFKQYRGRVVERFGEALDKELRYNVKTKEIEEIVVNEDGTETIVKKTMDVINPDDVYSPYARCWDCGCTGWTKDPEYNLMFLKDQQRYANDMLKTKGHLFLNEVHDMLGLPRTKAGQVVGWIYDEECPNGDNHVDFGIYDINKPANRDFVNGYERSIWLDFNVDGNIMDLI